MNTDKENEWWEAYAYDSEKLHYIIPNYKIERFKDEVNSLKAELEKARELVKDMRQIGEHRHDCVFVIDEDSEECTCEYGDIWWTRVNEFLKKEGEQ